jgi:eukaryotic translation initiation factor 2C
MRQKSALGAGVAKLSVNEDFPTRPAYGTRGKPITLWANYFNLEPAKNLVLYRYHVSVLPEAKGRKLKRIFDLLIQEPSLARSATDFKTFLILRNKVEEIEVDVAYRSEFEDDPQPNTRPYRVKIHITGQIEVAALLPLDAASDPPDLERPFRSLSAGEPGHKYHFGQQALFLWC